MRRVVITGLGTVAPGGNTTTEAWDSVRGGRSAVVRISQFDPSDLPVQIAAEVKGFDPTTVMEAKEARQSSRFVQLAVASCRQAIADSHLDPSVDSFRYGCVIGVAIGAWGDLEQQAGRLAQDGPRKVSPFGLPYALVNMASGFVPIATQLRGPSFCTATACASGTHAIGEAYFHVAMGTADAMIAGGAESTICPLCVAFFARMRALSKGNDSPRQASRPFDLNRDGFVMGEGSGALVLEEYEHARRRGAHVYAEIVGYGLSTDAFHISQPAPGGRGAIQCMSAALQSAKIDPQQVDYVNAHGTSTQANDAIESAAIQDAFGDHARRMAISSTKGVTGHCLGAAGAIEAVFTVLALHHGVIPPTANYQDPDPACPLDYTPNTARERPLRYAMSNSFGFGGQNACIVFKSP